MTGATDSEGLREKGVGGYFCVAHRNGQIEYSVNVATYVTQEIPELQMLWTPDRTASLTPDMSQFSSLEGIGISGPADITDDELAIQNFNESIESNGDIYFVTWPWKNKNPELPENKHLA